MTKTLITKKALQCQINEEIQRKNPSRNRRRLNEDINDVYDKMSNTYEKLMNFIDSQRSTISNTLSKYGFDPKCYIEQDDETFFMQLIPTNKHIKDNFKDIKLYIDFITAPANVPDNSDLSDVRMELYVSYKPYGSSHYHLENTNKYQCTVPEIPKIISLILRDLNKRLILVGKSHDPFNQGDFKIIGTTLVAYKGNDSDVTIPNSVTKISDKAFQYCKSLTSITIPNSVTKIGESVFSNCSSLKSITIPNSVKSIGEWAFDNCESLTSITIPNSVTKISDNVFAACISLTTIKIPNSVTSIGRWAFYNCSSLKSITIPNSVRSIGNWVFEDCNNLTDIKIPERFKDEDTLKEIGLNDKQIDNLLDSYTWD